MYAVLIPLLHIVVYRSDTEAAARIFIKQLKAELIKNRLKANGIDPSICTKLQLEQAAEVLKHLEFKIQSWSECVKQHPDQAELFVLKQVLSRQ